MLHKNFCTNSMFFFLRMYDINFSVAGTDFCGSKGMKFLLGIVSAIFCSRRRTNTKKDVILSHFLVCRVVGGDIRRRWIFRVSLNMKSPICERGFSLVNIFNILFRESCVPWEQQWSLRTADYPKWRATRTLDSQLKILLTIYTYF